MSVNFNLVAVAGRLGRDARVRETKGGCVMDFSLAISEFSKNGNEFVERTSWVEVSAWNALAKNYGAKLKKGANVLIEGSLRQERWEKDGVKKDMLRIVARVIRMVPAGVKAVEVEDRGPQEPASAGNGVDEDEPLPF